jgi:hypothetical protein
MPHHRRRHLTLVVAAAALAGGCDDTPPAAPEYYDRVIQPILTASCTKNQGGCHRDDGTGGALGNLDLSSYEATTRRKDVLRTYGSYPEPLLLLKGAGPGSSIPYKPGRGDGKTAFLPSEIQHAGGAPIDRNSQAFFELQRWLANGATRDGSLSVRTLDATGRGACTADFASARPDLAARFDLSTVKDTDPLYMEFLSDVAPVVAANCAFASCHSSPQSDFFLTCNQGDGAKFNFLEVRDFVSAPPETSEFLLRPLAPASGGVSHTGGVFFANTADPNYQAFLRFATAAKAPMSGAMKSAGRQFFEENVMPVLLARGCALEACHSPGAPNDFKLRPGSQGYFSASALDRNYEEARRNFLDVDVPDPRVSRVVRKPVVRRDEGGIGIPHRGGPVLQSPGDPPGLDPTACPAWDPTTATPFCTLVEWHRRERADLVAAGTVDALAAGDTMSLAYVQRPPDTDALVDVDAYRPGADLILASAVLGPLGTVMVGAPAGSLLDNCPGTAASRDVRHPDFDYDGSRVVFALRTAQADTFDLYTVDLQSRACTKLTDGNGGSRNGLPLHNLDPIFAPTTPSSIVFASTRGRAAVGPTLSLKKLLVQTDLFRMSGKADGSFDAPVQLTVGLGAELGPAMMANGQISMTAEKASADFYQLSGRRINWDGTDYHPLLAQRKLSRGFDPQTLSQPMSLDQIPTHPSVGFQRATEIREGIDRSFVFIASDEAAPGAGGALATFNRSVGPFEADRAGASFLHSMEVLDGDGHAAGAGYRSPVQLPDGRYLVSYSGDTSVGAYDLVVFDPAAPAGAQRTTLIGCGGQACVQAALGYKRERKPVFTNVRQLVFGGGATGGDAAHGTVTYPDLPMLGTLLGANLRTGRFVDALRSATQVAIYEDRAPTDLAAGMGARTGSEMVFQDRHLLGAAPLAADGSVKLRLPSLTPLIVELQDGAGSALFTMSEEDQLGAGEAISRGVPQPFFNSVCGGCHGSVSGRELDIAIDPDALTGASVSTAHDADAQSIGP